VEQRLILESKGNNIDITTAPVIVHIKFVDTSIGTDNKYPLLIR